jgi:cysteine desulfurase/selenocysteine lyase
MNVETLRDTIPALNEGAYCNWGASGPSPRPVLQSFTEFAERHEFEVPVTGDPYDVAWDHYDNTRAAVATFLNARPEEIALTTSTSDGINRVLGAFDWDETTTIVTTGSEHPAVTLPIRKLARHRNVTVETVDMKDGLIDLESAKAALQDATLFVFSAIDWIYGKMQPVRELVNIAHEAGSRVLIDAVQVIGQRPLDVQNWGADMVAAAGHKWLLSTWGSGILYVESSFADSLEPQDIGYRSVVTPTADDFEYKSGAPRFEVGTVNGAPYAALQQAIRMVEAVGVDTIRNRIQQLTDRLKAGFPQERLRSPKSFESGLVSVVSGDPEAAVDRLRSQDIVVRALPIGETVRVSLHAVNTTSDVDALVEGLQT